MVTRDLLRAAHNLRYLLLCERDRQHSILEAVVSEDVGKRWRDNHAEPKLPERPWRVLTRRTTTKILVCDQNRRALVLRFVQHKRGIQLSVLLVTPVIKQKLPKAGALDPFQKLLWNDLIRVDIRPIERRD